MRYKLVIAEKPSVAQSLAAVIGATARKDGYLEGNGWRVSWCVGHLAGLADADSYDPKYAKWRYDDLPILPEHWQMVVGKDKKKQFDILKKLINAPDVTEVVNACDAGREGELIFRSVYELAGCQKPMKRLWISSMEDSAIREGFANLRPGADYDGLRDAALCRAKADWLVGINATRLFSVLYHRTLNIGRVMSPTLALIVQREAEIDTFKPVPFYTVSLELPGLTVSGERMSDRASAEQLKYQAVGVFQQLSVHHDKVVGQGIDAVVQSFFPVLEQLLSGKRHKNGRGAGGQPPLDLDLVKSQGQTAHQPFFLLKVQSGQLTVILLGNRACLKDVVSKLTRIVRCVQHQKGNQEHSLISALQILQQLFRLTAVGGKVTRNYIHVVSGADCFFLFLDLAAVQVSNLALYRFDGFHLIHRLNVHTHNERAFHIQKISQQTVIQLWG